MVKLDYRLVAVGAILRDHAEPTYLNEEHERLVDIADSLYNTGIPLEQWRDNPEFDYKALAKSYGSKYWRAVMDEMSALDTDYLNANRSDVQELIKNYEELKEVYAN